MDETTIVCPGDGVDATLLPTAHKRRLGNGLKQDFITNEFTSTIAGMVDVDLKRKTASISTPNARYVARAGDSVIAQVRGSSLETYHLYINAYSPQGILPQLAFEGASKKTRPILRNGDLVYARIVFAQKNMDIELSCVNPNTGKADGLGPLTDGMLFEVSLGFADRLLKKQVVSVLDELGTKIPGGFEIVVGKNGKVWVDCADAGARGILAVGKVLQQTDEGNLHEKLVNRTVKEFGLA